MKVQEVIIDTDQPECKKRYMLINTRGQPIVHHAKVKSDKALHKVEETLKQMIKLQKKINFNSVAEEAGVSKGFIYKHKALRIQIENLRQQQEGLSHSKQVKRNMSDASKDVIISSLRKKINELEKENKE